MGTTTAHENLKALPEAIPVFPLTGVLLLPRTQLPLNIFEPRYLAMTDDALRTDRLIGMIQPERPDSSLQGNPAIRQVGCAGRITQFSETGDGRYLITLTGLMRFRIIEEIETTSAYRRCKVDYSEFFNDLAAPEPDDELDRDVIVNVLQQFSEAKHLRIDWSEIERATNCMLINAMSMMGPFGPEEKQALLEAPDIRARSKTLVAIMEFEMAKHSGSTSKLQ